MPQYTFELEPAMAERHIPERIEEFFTMANAPKIGETIVRDVRTYRRVVDGLQIKKDNWFEYTSNSLPRNIQVPGLTHDSRGRPQIKSRAIENEVMARGGLIRD